MTLIGETFVQLGGKINAHNLQKLRAVLGVSNGIQAAQIFFRRGEQIHQIRITQRERLQSRVAFCDCFL